MSRIVTLAAMLAISCTAAGAASAACPTGKGKTCVDLNVTPTVSDQVVVVTSDRSPLPSKIAPLIDNKPPYTGPTLGVSKTVHKAPMVGYRWAID